MRQSFVKSENGTVYYWHTDIDSMKRTLFFLHGLTADHTMFENKWIFSSMITMLLRGMHLLTVNQDHIKIFRMKIP